MGAAYLYVYFKCVFSLLIVHKILFLFYLFYTISFLSVKKNNHFFENNHFLLPIKLYYYFFVTFVVYFFFFIGEIKKSCKFFKI